MIRYRTMGGLATAALMALTAAPAWAKNTMLINVNVVRSCNIGALPMMFGNVSIINPSAITQANLIIDCTPNTTFTVTMDDGLHVKNGKRRMANPAANGVREYLEYEVYSNAARTTRWGNTPVTGITRTAPASGRMTLTAYGRADGRRSVASRYEDTITVTLTF